MLRLDRFSSWYTDKLHGDSPYEQELTRLLLDEFVNVSLDGGKRMNDRYRIMRAFNPCSPAHRTVFPDTVELTRHLNIDTSGWNQEAWHCVYRDGIPPLIDKGISDRYRKWVMEDDHPGKGGQFMKLHFYFSLLTGRGVSLSCPDTLSDEYMAIQRVIHGGTEE